MTLTGTLILDILQTGALIAVLIVYQLQLQTMRQQLEDARKTAKGQALLDLASFLQAEDVRDARGIVRKAPKDHPWSKDVERAAAKVCSSYDTVGTLIQAGVVEPLPVIRQWGPSICECYEALEGFIREKQQPHESGSTYYSQFDALYKLASGSRGRERRPSVYFRALEL